MTDRVNSFLVVLEKDMRTDDVQPTLDALNQIKGVISVTPNIVDPMSLVAEIRARRSILNKMYEVFESTKAE